MNILELTTSCRLLQNKNPRDPWTNQGPIPLPDNEKMDKFLHYDQDTRPGCEDWHDPVDIPFSGTYLRILNCSILFVTSIHQFIFTHPRIFFNEIWHYDYFNDAVKCILMPP